MEEKVEREVDGGKKTEKYPGKGGSLECLKSQKFILRRRERKIFEEKIWNARRVHYGILTKREKKGGIMAERNTFRDEFVWKVGLEKGSPIACTKKSGKTASSVMVKHHSGTYTMQDCFGCGGREAQTHIWKITWLYPPHC